MARAAAKGRKSAQGNARPVAAPAKKSENKPPKYEDALFFNRLRNHAKWVFVALAVVFALTFVVAGVGTGSLGLGSALDGIFSSSGDALKGAQDKAKKNPKDPAAWQALATAAAAKGKAELAVQAAQREVALTPKSGDALRRLAALQFTLAQTQATAAQAAQAAAADASAGSIFDANPLANGASIFQSDPITQALVAKTQSDYVTAVTNARTAYADVVKSYRSIAELTPTDATAWLSLAQIAGQTGDTATALVGFRKALALDPHGINAPAIRKQIKALQKQAAASSSSSASSSGSSTGK